jgi:ADP-ribose pyrophosphatase
MSKHNDQAAEGLDAAAGKVEDVQAQIVDDERLMAPQDAGAALDGMGSGDARGLMDLVAHYTFDGDRSSSEHASGRPEQRGFVRGGDDPRDPALCERIQAEDVAWRGRIFDVDTLQVELPDGRPARRDVVRHPGAVAIVALTDDGRICLVRQYRTALDRVTVEIPAGKLDPGEDPLDCARRELTEETGFVAERMAFLTTIATSVGFADELIHIYMATGLSFAESSPDADEFINVDLVPLQDFIDAVLDGQVEDAKTVVGALVCDAVSHRLG